jgi:hypothetical protein
MELVMGHEHRAVCDRPSEVQSISVMHTNGWHCINVRFCNCTPNEPIYVQLLRARLFPATYDRPSTVFSFDVLDLFEELTLQSKTSMYDFFQTICSVTGKDRPRPNVSLLRYLSFASSLSHRPF